MSQTVPIPFGEGLDRDSGSMVVAATSHEDVRNAHLTEGMALLVKGSVSSAEFLDPDDDEPIDVILAGHAMKVENAGVVIGYRTSTRKLHVYRTTRAGTSPSHIGVWFTLNASAVTPPIAILAEVSGFLFMAHDEPSVTLRAATAYYDPTSASLFSLTADWAHATLVDPTGANNAIRYRPVAPIGSGITVEYVDPGAPGAALAVVVVGSAITVNLATDGGSVITTIANDIVAAIQASDDASALVAVSIPPDEDGTGLATAIGPVDIGDQDGIRFRGVVEHLGAFLGGWAYGSELETRSDLVRMSMPGQPTTFRLKDYDSFGQKGDPVVGCFSTGRTLLVYKGEETWEQFGTNRSNFGKRQLDTKVGLLASRLAIVVDGACVAWSHIGPRVSDGSPPVDLSIPLALYAPAPTDLVAEGDSVYAFAVLLPNRNELRFHFGRRYYAYSLITKRWSYGEMNVAPTCGFLLPGGDSSSVSAGFASDLAVTSDTEGA